MGFSEKGSIRVLERLWGLRGEGSGLIKSEVNWGV